MFTVTLLKGPKGQRQWFDVTEKRAIQRADALAYLHNAEIVRNGDNWLIDASAYYGKGN